VAATVAAALALVLAGFWIGRSSGTDRRENVGIDLDAFAAAWGSGDADAIRAFYTDDAVIQPLGHLLTTLHDDPQTQFWNIESDEIEGEAADHNGATLEYLTAARIGDVVVTTFRWTFPDGFRGVPPGGEIVGSDIMHVRDGLIWRHFTSFEPWVNGERVDL